MVATTRYEHIVNMLEHILLASGTDLHIDGDSNNTVPKIDVVSLPRWERVAQEAYSHVSGSVPQGSAFQAKYDDLYRSLVYVPSGYGHLIRVLRGQVPFCQFRYWDFRTEAEGTNNRYAFQWDICLDMLIPGDQYINTDQPVADRQTHTGIYSTERGRFVDQIVARFAAWPVLEGVRRHPQRPDSFDEDRYWLGGDVAMTRLTSLRRTGWQLLRDVTPKATRDALIEEQPAISHISISDGTDLNYWTLLWAHGVPEAYQGYFPTTLKFVVTEKRQIKVGGTAFA